MGIKKAQTPSHISCQACDSPNTTMDEVCAMVRSFNVVLFALKSLSRSQFGRIIEQQKVAIVNCVAKILTFHENCSRKMLFLVIFTDLII